jgi:predicted RNA-binding Zn-ribbon protein involved in translation (DUF1610 family)
VTTTDPQAARARRRNTIRWLLGLVSLTPAGHADLRTAVEAELADADEAHARLADYEHRITWETTCGEHARLLDACQAAEQRAEQAEELLRIAENTSNQSETARQSAEWDARIYRDRLDRLSEGYTDQRQRAEQAEAAITRVRAQGADWAQLAPPGDVGMTPSDTAFAEAGRIILAALDGTAPTAKLLEKDADRVVAYESAAGFLYCTTHGGELSGAYRRISEDLPDGGICHSCGADVLADPEPEAPCFHPSWETETTVGARRCTDCGEWLDPQPPRTAVQGVCPACGSSALFLGEGGYVTCARDHCPEPDAASTLLEHDPRQDVEPGTAPVLDALVTELFTAARRLFRTPGDPS